MRPRNFCGSRKEHPFTTTRRVGAGGADGILYVDECGKIEACERVTPLVRTRTPRVETMTYAEHIETLVAQHGIVVDWRDRTAARSWRRSRRVRLERVRGASTYAVALHEIGHVVGPQRGRRLDKEAQAWRWAEANAVEWTDGMARLASRCIETYLRWCERKRGAWVPPKGHDSRRLAAMRRAAR